MYYSYVEIEYVATSFSPARTDLAVKLLNNSIMEKLFKHPGFSEPACDGQHGYRVLPVSSSFIDI
jgi:hypothetical protein